MIKEGQNQLRKLKKSPETKFFDHVTSHFIIRQRRGKILKFFLPANTHEVFETVELTFSASVGRVGPVIEKNMPMATRAPTMATMNHAVALLFKNAFLSNKS